MKHKKDTVSDGIHDYATNMKPKTYQISLFFLKIYYHQERIEIQFFRQAVTLWIIHSVTLWIISAS